MQRGFHTVDHQGVARVVSALKAHHALGAFGEPIDQFSLALITPLGADDHYISTFGCIHFAQD